MKKYILKQTIYICKGFKNFFNGLINALEDAAFENQIKKNNKQGMTIARKD